LDHSTLKKEWEGEERNITAEKFANAFRWWYQGCQKCIKIGTGYVEKSKERKVLLTITVVDLLKQFAVLLRNTDLGNMHAK
jgi:hypothetical protein